MNEKLNQIYKIIKETISKYSTEYIVKEMKLNTHDTQGNVKENLADDIMEMYFKENNEPFRYVEENMIGINKYQYIFDNQKDFEKAFYILKSKGQVEITIVNNMIGINYKIPNEVFKKSIYFPEKIFKEIENEIFNIYGESITLGDEKIPKIKEELGEIGAILYNKYYNWYNEYGYYDIYDYVDAFYVGNIDEIKEKLDEIIDCATKRDDINKNEKILIIQEVEEDKLILDELLERNKQNDEEIFEEI